MMTGKASRCMPFRFVSSVRSRELACVAGLSSRHSSRYDNKSPFLFGHIVRIRPNLLAPHLTMPDTPTVPAKTLNWFKAHNRLQAQLSTQETPKVGDGPPSGSQLPSTRQTK